MCGRCEVGKLSLCQYNDLLRISLQWNRCRSCESASFYRVELLCIAIDIFRIDRHYSLRVAALNHIRVAAAKFRLKRGVVHMDQRGVKALLFCGYVIPVWLLVGVVIAGVLYPNYSHLAQALSELGAVGAPTHFISPAINNIPLGILFFLFALGVLLSRKNNGWFAATSVLLFLHGIGSIGAGIYSCDAGCMPENPSLSQNIHNFSGLVMFFSLLVANAIWIFIGRSVIGFRYFMLISSLCLVVSIVTVPLMLHGANNGTLGLFQRLNYGSQVIWVMALAYCLRAKSSDVLASEE